MAGEAGEADLEEYRMLGSKLYHERHGQALQSFKEEQSKTDSHLERRL